MSSAQTYLGASGLNQIGRAAVPPRPSVRIAPALELDKQRSGTRPPAPLAARIAAEYLKTWATLPWQA